MKKYLILSFYLTLQTNLFCVGVFDKLFGITTKIQTEKTQLENSVNKKFSDISAELALVKELQVNTDLKVSALSGNTLKLQDVEGLVNAKIVGYDRSVKTETNAGRDISTVNESDLMKFIVDKWAWIAVAILASFISLIGSIFSLFKWQGKMYERLLDAKQKWIENLIQSNNEKDDKMDSWLMGKIDKNED